VANRKNATRDGSRRLPGGVGLEIGRIFGVRVTLDVTLILAFLLVASGLGRGTLPAWHPDWPPSLVWGVALGAAALFFVSVLLHELSHAIVARMQGNTVRGITLFILGGIAHIEEEPATPGGEFAMAIVGPLTSLLIGVLCLTLGGLALSTGDHLALAQHPVEALRGAGALTTLLLWLGPLNLILGVFNLVPGFPLDGGRVLRSILWAIVRDREKASVWAAFAGQAFGLALTAAGLLMVFGSVFPIVGGGPVQGVWFVFLGFYLTSAARQTIERGAARSALGNVLVREIMISRFETVEPDLPLEQFVHRHLLGTEQRCFPVTSQGRFLGVVSFRDVRAQERDWPRLRVVDVMTPAAQVHTVRPDAQAADALDELTRHDVAQLVVVGESGVVVGLLRRQDVLRWLSLRAASSGTEDVPRRASGHITTSESGPRL
jgi:Zn-dependent protease/predicted transcriptional regulator